ncbi:hypothetical protein [Halonotius roseus]|uniref:Uncharacterized protein n=1 Tax=Halonotius roseus TaxID=2511997 RepID=A0A544QR09_9EURY|nr:hypothetical protein [Halonotius roseus]TQQ81867.1 hypothetical protein EWF95_02715 [Halonotius roseus]
MAISHAGSGEGIETPQDVNVMSIHEREASHGSPKGEPGLIVLWDGNGYDSKQGSWLMCHEEIVCNLAYWQ